ncbi:hypothetical protein Jann_0622 [Jannaschia sp. CCS1]|nr:hypothetical protein Jann_0622 [Jannaschia sp. CCS1]
MTMSLTSKRNCTYVACGQSVKMNANPVKNPNLLSETVEELFVNFGARRVLFEVTARVFRKFHPPDRVRSTDLDEVSLSAHLRKDIGLPFECDEPRRVDPVTFHVLNRP